MKIKYLVLLLAIILINPVSAKFICGEVIQTDNVTPSWYDAKIFLKSNPTYSSICKVSPSNNKYCCDIDSIQKNFGYIWNPGDIFTSQITDTNSGYFASGKDTEITGEGYDVAPKLTLQKAIRVTFPTSILTILNSSLNTTLNISSSCSESNAPESIPLTFGKNTLSFSAICNEEIFTLNKTFFIIQNITFQKEYSNFRNNPNKPKIRSTKTGTINLSGSLSSSIENIPLKEYVPSSWEISEISNNGTIEFSTSEYNLITWKISGENFNVNYNARAPKTGIQTENFIFKTEIDEHDLGEVIIEVHKIIPIPFPTKSSNRGFKYTPNQLSKVSEELPLIFEKDNLTAVLYSTTPKEEGAFNLQEFLYSNKIDKNFDLIKSYKVQTNLNSTEKGMAAFEYETSKKWMEEKNYKEIWFFEKHKNKLFKITGEVISNNGDIIKYRFESENSPSEIFILAEKNKISPWRKILNFWHKIKFW